MKTILKPVYYCDHCKKKSLVKSSMVKHENVCSSNPENIPACFSPKGYDCVYLNNDDPFKLSCKKYKLKLHTITARKKGLPEKYPESFVGSKEMPSQCPSQRYLS